MNTRWHDMICLVVISIVTSTIAPVISSAAPVVETTLVALPTGLCGLDPYSDSESNSHNEMDSLEYFTPLPATSPFLYTDSFEAPDSSDRPPSQDPYVMAVLVRGARELDLFLLVDLHGGVYHLVLQTTAYLLLVHLQIHHQFILQVWMHQIRLILDLQLEMYHLNRVTLRGEPSPPSRVILFDDIPTVIPSTSVVAPETSTIAPVISSVALVVETTLVSSPTGLCGLVPYSGSDSDSPDEMSSPEHISLLLYHSYAPILLRLLILLMDHHQDPYVAIIARWRSRVTTLPSSSSGFYCSVTACQGFDDGTFLSTRGGYLLLVVAYSTILMGRVSCCAVRKRGWDLYQARRFAGGALPRSSDHHPSSSSSSLALLPVHSSEASFRESQRKPSIHLHILLDHLARDVDPWLILDSYSSESSIEEDTVVDHIETKVDIKLGIGDGDDVRDHVEIDPRDVKDNTEEYEADTSAGDMVEVGIDPLSAPIVEEGIVEPAGEDSSDSSGTRDDIVKSFKDMLIDLDTITCMSLRLENLKVRAMLDIKRDHVNSLRLHMSLSQEEFRHVRKDRNDTQGRLRRLESYVERHLDLKLGNGNDNGGDGNGNGTRNGNNGGDNDDGNENRNVNGKGDRHVARKCTYQDFMKCQPLGFKGTEGVVGLIRWSEKMEIMFHISNSPERYQVKYATCTLLDSALTWWNSHKRTIKTDAAYALSWRELLKLMTEVYCPINEIQKMETELWNLSVKNNDMATYTQRFQELTMMCTKMVPEEEDRVERFIGGLPDNI
ncbi:putative reverse transcriptase domain-containing protein [Tanacetum coccineum]